MTFKPPTVESYREQRTFGNDNGRFWVERYCSAPNERDIPTWSATLYCDEFDNGERYYHVYLERWIDVPRYPLLDAPNWDDCEDLVRETKSKEDAVSEAVATLERRAMAYLSIAASFRGTFPQCFEGGKS